MDSDVTNLLTRDVSRRIRLGGGITGFYRMRSPLPIAFSLSNSLSTLPRNGLSERVLELAMVISEEI